jgi:hypothetical protein
MLTLQPVMEPAPNGPAAEEAVPEHRREQGVDWATLRTLLTSLQPHIQWQQAIVAQVRLAAGKTPWGASQLFSVAPAGDNRFRLVISTVRATELTMCRLDRLPWIASVDRAEPTVNGCVILVTIESDLVSLVGARSAWVDFASRLVDADLFLSA